MKVIFNTKITDPDYTSHNGEEVEIIEVNKGKDIYSDRYTVRFKNGMVAENVMSCEIEKT